jgi:hypothetical protein
MPKILLCGECEKSQGFGPRQSASAPPRRSTRHPSLSKEGSFCFVAGAKPDLFWAPLLNQEGRRVERRGGCGRLSWRRHFVGPSGARSGLKRVQQGPGFVVAKTPPILTADHCLASHFPSSSRPKLPINDERECGRKGSPHLRPADLQVGTPQGISTRRT